MESNIENTNKLYRPHLPRTIKNLILLGFTLMNLKFGPIIQSSAQDDREIISQGPAISEQYTNEELFYIADFVAGYLRDSIYWDETQPDGSSGTFEISPDAKFDGNIFITTVVPYYNTKGNEGNGVVTFTACNEEIGVDDVLGYQCYVTNEGPMSPNDAQQFITIDISDDLGEATGHAYVVVLPGDSDLETAIEEMVHASVYANEVTAKMTSYVTYALLSGYSYFEYTILMNTAYIHPNFGSITGDQARTQLPHVYCYNSNAYCNDGEIGDIIPIISESDYSQLSHNFYLYLDTLSTKSNN